MQNLDNLVNRLLDDAKKEAEEITLTAEGRVSSILKEAQIKADEHKESVAYDLKKKELDMRRLFKVSLELEERDALLRTKGEKIDKVLSEIPDAIRNMDKSEYRMLIKKMMAESMPLGKVDVYPSKLDEDMIDADFLKEVQDMLTKANKDVDLTLKDTTVDIYGGVLLKTDILEVDCSIDSLVRSKSEDLEYFLAGELFKGLDQN